MLSKSVEYLNGIELSKRDRVNVIDLSRIELSNVIELSKRDRVIETL